jgi:Sel1 repeat
MRARVFHRLWWTLIFWAIFEGIGIGNLFAQPRGQFQVIFEANLSHANKGDAKSQYEVGDAYKTGYGVEQDVVKACEWFQRAALQNYAEAQLELSRCYSENGGFGANLNEARKWLLASAKNKSNSNPGLAQIQNNLGGEYKKINVDDLAEFANYGIATQSDLDKTIAAMRANPYFVKNFNDYGPVGVRLWIAANNQADKKKMSLTQSLELIKKQQEVASQRQIKERAEQEAATEPEKTKTYEQEKNSWYTYKKFLNTYVCDQSGSGDSNPGTMLSYAKNYQDPSAHAENEIKEGNQIIAVDIVLPRIGGVIRYVRGKQRCEAIIKRLNTQIQNEEKALKDKYK